MNGDSLETKCNLVVEWDVGGVEEMAQTYFENTDNWSYIPTPTKEDRDVAINIRNNQLLGYYCQTCKSTSSKLLKCQACKAVHYCDKDCQRKDWPAHLPSCVREKVVLQPNPRYPLAKV